MLLIFAVVTTLVVLIPVAYRDRIDWTGPVRMKFYLAFGIAAVGMAPYVLGNVLVRGWFGNLLEAFGFVIGLVAAGLLAMTVLENARTIQLNLQAEPEPPAEKPAPTLTDKSDDGQGPPEEQDAEDESSDEPDDDVAQEDTT